MYEAAQPRRRELDLLQEGLQGDQLQLLSGKSDIAKMMTMRIVEAAELGASRQ